ncbi:alpha/beta hydrolase [Rhizobium leguminosarum]|uniref:alpha/beta hydrolase n=1 Tax=Rhizobium leguminosarum TaxID=384 RepID=UPI001C9859DC|nr:alpha/beta hydrolase [Rhizobium leguminosarum]MBY5904159.1 alpha/beta hydrolase [Rhizobium leguminosarum]MBY5911528.1 alpha/beta hydrolase [Rhizobium leguminosarum]
MEFASNFAIIWAGASKRLVGRPVVFSSVWLRGAVVFSILSVVGFERPGTSSAVADSLPSPIMVDMLVATNPRCDVDAMANETLQPGPEFLEITVSIPPSSNRVPGEVQWSQQFPPNPASDFVLIKRESVNRKSAETWLHKSVNKNAGRSVILFVHPLENSIENAAFRFAQIIHDSRVATTPLLATWPSHQMLLGAERDRDCANSARSALRLLIQRMLLNPGVNEFSILTHSTGNQAVIDALNQIAVRSGAVPPKLTNVVLLTSGDLDSNTFLSQIADMGEPRPRVTIFILREDKKAIGSSEGDDVVPPGSVDLESKMAVQTATNVTVIDLAKLRSGDRLNHGKFAGAPEIVKLFGDQFTAGQVLWDDR